MQACMTRARPKKPQSAQRGGSAVAHFAAASGTKTDHLTLICAMQ
jgi:hypothetical protein